MAIKLIGCQVRLQECEYDTQCSGNSILGGPSCDAIGHWVTPVYKEEDEKEEDYTMCKYCGYPDDHCKCGCAYYD